MKLIYNELIHPIHWNQDTILKLTIENKVFYRKFLMELTEQIKNKDEAPFKVMKEGEDMTAKLNVMIDLFHLENTEAAIINSLRNQLVKYLQEEYDKATVLKQTIVKAFQECYFDQEFDVFVGDELNLRTFAKLLDISVDFDAPNLVERLVNYIETSYRLELYKVFLLVNLSLYLSKEETELFEKEMVQKKIPVMLLERDHTHSSEWETNFIVTENLSELF